MTPVDKKPKTKERGDNHSTEYGLWLRQQGELCSYKGFRATNVDFLWWQSKTGQRLVQEEKRYSGRLSYSQAKQFQWLDELLASDETYFGFFFVQFENTCPDDGRIAVNGVPFSKEQLISLLQFEQKVLKLAGQMDFKDERLVNFNSMNGRSRKYKE
jgi:hypothetical protein